MDFEIGKEYTKKNGTKVKCVGKLQDDFLKEKIEKRIFSVYCDKQGYFFMNTEGRKKLTEEQKENRQKEKYKQDAPIFKELSNKLTQLTDKVKANNKILKTPTKYTAEQGKAILDENAKLTEEIEQTREKRKAHRVPKKYR